MRYTDGVKRVAPHGQTGDTESTVRTLGAATACGRKIGQSISSFGKDMSQSASATHRPERTPPRGQHGIALSPDQLKQVLDVSRMLAVTTDLDALLTRIAEAVTAMLGCERASIFLHDPKTTELWTKVALQAKEIRIPC